MPLRKAARIIHANFPYGNQVDDPKKSVTKSLPMSVTKLATKMIDALFFDDPPEGAGPWMFSALWPG